VKLIRLVDREDVMNALDEVEAKCGVETANMLRAVYDGLAEISSVEFRVSSGVAPSVEVSGQASGWYGGR
jgi:hypothetical protein